MISKKFLTSSFIYTFSSTLSTVASFLLLPFYTNTNLLSISDVGALSLYIGFSLLVQLLAGLSLDYYVSVAYHELKDKPDELRQKISSLNGYLIIAGFVILLILMIFGNLFIHYYFQTPGAFVFRYALMSALTGIFNAHFRFYNSLLLNKEKPWRYFWSNMLNFVTTVAFSLFLLEKFPLTLEGPLWGRLLSCACIFGWSFVDVTRSYGISFDRKYLKPVYRFCLPLIITAVFQWALGYSSNYIIKPLLYNKEVAIFDLAMKFTLLISFVLDGLSSAMVPKVFGLFSNEQSIATQKEVNKYYSSFNLLMLLLIPLNIFLLPLLLPLFISSEKYLQAFLYFGIISAGLATRSIQNLFIYPLYFQKQTTKLLWVYGISAVLQVVVSYVMILQFKLYGAAFAMNLIKVIQLLLFGWFCRSILAPGFNFGKMVLLPMAALILISAGEMFINGYGIKMHFIHATEMASVTLLIWIFYKNEIKDLWQWGKKKWLTI